MKYAIQIYLFRDYCGTEKDTQKTTARIAAMGYNGIEFHGCAAASPGALKNVFDDCGIEPLNIHIDFDVWRENWRQGLDDAKKAGLRAVTFGWIPPESRTDEVFAWVRDMLPVFSEECKARGLDIYYHNHDFEFAPYQGGLLLDWLTADAADVRIQLDTFWVKYAGFDPLEAMNTYRDKLELLHIKDYISMEPEFKGCPIGRGKMENLPVIRKADEFGLDYVISDLDNSIADVFETAKESLRYLRRIL